MSPERVLYFYNAGLWNIQMVRNAVKKGIITRAQFAEITGEDYDTSENVTAAEFMEMVEEVL